MSGEFDKLKGEAKEAVGDATGNESLEAEGKKDQAVGTVKDKVDDAKDTITRRLTSTQTKTSAV